jgi:ABC-type amino acid transport substrate-binding protein
MSPLQPENCIPSAQQGQVRIVPAGGATRTRWQVMFSVYWLTIPMLTIA